MRQNKLEEAETVMREVYQRRQHVLGDDHPDTLETASQLGVVLVQRGQPTCLPCP